MEICASKRAASAEDDGGRAARNLLCRVKSYQNRDQMRQHKDPWVVVVVQRRGRRREIAVLGRWWAVVGASGRSGSRSGAQSFGGNRRSCSGSSYIRNWIRSRWWQITLNLRSGVITGRGANSIDEELDDAKEAWRIFLFSSKLVRRRKIIRSHNILNIIRIKCEFHIILTAMNVDWRRIHASVVNSLLFTAA